MSWLVPWFRRRPGHGGHGLPVHAGPEAEAWHNFHRRCVDSSGFHREAALRDLPGLPVGLQARAVPLVLARLNDWVPQVRAAAAQALQPLLRDELEAAWMQALPEVVRLMAGERWRTDGRALQTGIEHFLLKVPRRRQALLACAPAWAPRVRDWLVVQSWLHADPAESLAAMTQALSGVELRLARHALRQLQAMSPVWPDLPGVRAALARSPFPGLRLVLLRQDQGQGRFPEGDDALALGLSRHGGTRSWLLFHADATLKQRLQARAEAVLDAGGQSGPQRVALQLLGELRAPCLPARLLVARDQPRASLREMAHRLAQATLDEPDRVAWAQRAMADPSPRVQAVALHALQRGRTTMTVSELQALVRREPGTIRPVLTALGHFEAWARAPATLELLADGRVDTERAIEALKSLRVALAHSRYAARPAQQAAVEQAAARLRERRPELVFSPT